MRLGSYIHILIKNNSKSYILKTISLSLNYFLFVTGGSIELARLYVCFWWGEKIIGNHYIMALLAYQD
jgi:hypothetical protein